MSHSPKVEIIGHGPTTFWWPKTANYARLTYHFCTRNRCDAWPKDAAAHPMGWRWRRNETPPSSTGSGG